MLAVRQKKKDLTPAFLFILSPILSLPLLLKACYDNSKIAYVLLSIFFGLCGMLILPPKGDGYRHFVEFLYIQSLTWEEFCIYIQESIKFDFIIQFLKFVVAHIGLGFGYVKFLVVFISYILYFDLYDSFCVKNQLTSRQSRYCFFVILLSVPCFSIANGLRFGFATVLLSYVLCRWYILNRQEYWTYLLLVISCFVHFASLMLVIVLFLNRIMPNRMGKTCFCLLMIILYFLSENINLLIGMIPLSSALKSYILEYTEGVWKDGSALSGFNIFFWLPIVFNEYLSKVIILYFILKYIPYDKNSKIIYLFFILWSFTHLFYTINQRISMVILCVGGLFLLNYKIFNINFLRWMIFITFFGQVMMWRIYTINRWEYLWGPLPIALTMDYEKEWIDDNVNAEGDLYRIYK